MTKAYLNYPNPHMTIHGNVSCGDIAKMGKSNQREVIFTGSSFSQAVGQLASDSFRLMGQRYSRFYGAPIKRHC